jgi:non-ribosomal peptide synthetase component F
MPLAAAPDLVQRLRELAERLHATPFTVVLAAYGMALGRWRGLTDLVIACPITNRSMPQADHLVGFFVNTVPIRVAVANGDSFDDVVRRTRRAVFGALEHCAVPFERIVSELRPPRRPGEPPYFQAVLNYLGDEGRSLELAGLEVEELPGPRIAARAELALDVREHGGRLDGGLLYDPRMQGFEPVQRLMAELRGIIGAAT